MAKRKSSTRDAIVAALAERQAMKYTFPGSRFDRVTCKDLTGQARSRLWTELILAGYITPDSRGATAGVLTAKAYDELAPEAADTVCLADAFTYDPHYNRDGRKVWLVWTRLATTHKLAAVEQHRRNPSSVEFLAVLDYEDRSERFFPERGDGPADAYARLGKDRGFYDGTIAVRDAGVVAKAEAAAKNEYLKRALEAGLNWYLVSTGVLVEGGAELRVRTEENKFSLSTRPRLTGNPDEWTDESVAAFVKRCEEEYHQAEAGMHAARMFGVAVQKAGGAEKFRVAYGAAVTAEVDRKWAAEKGGA